MKNEIIYVIKIGGNIIDDEERLTVFLHSFAQIKHKKILIHGGGKLATRMAEDLQIPQQMVEGRRITDEATLRIVTMVYAGYINKNIVAKLQASGNNAIGICGVDGNLIKAHKRTNHNVDFGFVGDIDSVNIDVLDEIIQKNIAVVIAPITHDGHGQLLNTNADTIAQEIAKAVSKKYRVQLIYSFEKSGVLVDINDENSRIPILTPNLYEKYRKEEKIFAGMIPKLDNAFTAINAGVQSVVIGKADKLDDLISGKSGTTLKNE